MNLLRGVMLKKTPAITRETSSEIYVRQYFKLKIKKSVSQYPVFFVNRLVSGHLHLFPHVAKSSAANFTARKVLECCN